MNKVLDLTTEELGKLTPRELDTLMKIIIKTGYVERRKKEKIN